VAHIVRDLTYIARCGAHYRNLELEALGITGRQAGTLLAICHEPGISQEQLGKRVVLNKSNIARQLAALEDMGLVKRAVSANDRRVLQCYPTEKSQEMLPQIRMVYRAWRERLLQDMTPQEQEVLEKLLVKIKDRAGQWLEENRL
jgi:DNA-binding MarR family transcriptional regulator